MKKRNLEQVNELAKSGRLEIAFNSSVKEVRPTSLVLKVGDAERELACDQVFALIGADPPRAWIEKIGVPFVTREEAVVSWG